MNPSLFLTRHISIRVPWHDDEWKGIICRHPRDNSACIRLKNCKDGKAEERYAGPVAKIVTVSASNPLSSLTCSAAQAALFEGKPGQVYNFGGDGEMVNLELVKMILDKLGKPHSLISFVPDRLGHDRRYAIDSSFAQRELNWKPQRSFK